MFFNRLCAGTLINCMLAFSTDSCIRTCVLNLLGATHDSNQCFCGNVREKVGTVFEHTGFRASVDSAFNAQNRDSMVKLVLGDELSLRTLRARKNVSMRQLPERRTRAI